jgi:hypothetical protein
MWSFKDTRKHNRFQGPIHTNSSRTREYISCSRIRGDCYHSRTCVWIDPIMEGRSSGFGSQAHYISLSTFGSSSQMMETLLTSRPASKPHNLSPQNTSPSISSVFGVDIFTEILFTSLPSFGGVSVVCSLIESCV